MLNIFYGDFLEHVDPKTNPKGIGEIEKRFLK